MGFFIGFFELFLLVFAVVSMCSFNFKVKRFGLKMNDDVLWFVILGICLPTLCGYFVYIDYISEVKPWFIMVDFENDIIYLIKANKANFIDSYLTANASILFKIIILILFIGYCIILSSMTVFERYGIDYLFILLIFLYGILGLLDSNDLLVIYFFIEIQGFCGYILAGYNRRSYYASEAGLKYYLLGGMSSGLMLLGICLIYGFTGIFTLTDLFSFLVSTVSFDVLNLGFLFFFFGLLFKMGVFPMHNWLPDVYEGSMSMVTFFFAVLPKLSVFYIFGKIFYFLTNSLWLDILVYITLITVFIGCVGAIVQVKIKRLLAYSSISHGGFGLMSLIGNDKLGFENFLHYMLIYSISLFLLFGLILVCRNLEVFSLRKLLLSYSSMYESNSLLVFMIVIVIFSLAGVPPLAGFFAKLLVFLSLFKQGFTVYGLSCVLLSCLSMVYNLKLIRMFFFFEKKRKENVIPLSGVVSYMFMWIFFFIIFYIFFSNLFLVLLDIEFYRVFYAERLVDLFTIVDKFGNLKR